MQINPGELNKKIEIYSKSAEKTANGYPDNSKTPFCSCWAKFSRTSGTESLKSNADFSEIKVRFLIRFMEGITRKMIVRYSGNDYEIEYLNDYGDSNEYIEIFCTEVSNG